MKQIKDFREICRSGRNLNKEIMKSKNRGLYIKLLNECKFKLVYKLSNRLNPSYLPFELTWLEFLERNCRNSQVTLNIIEKGVKNDNRRI